MTLFNIADLEDAYRRFVERAVANGEVWVLISRDEEGAVVQSNHVVDDDGVPAAVELVFSTRAYANRLAHGDWSTYSPVSLSLKIYLERVLPALSDLGRLIMPDANQHLAGVEVVPADLGAALVATREGRLPDLRHVGAAT